MDKKRLNMISMRQIIINLGFGIILLLSSCSEDKFLDPKPADGTYSDEFIWANPTFARGILYEAYDNLPASFMDFSGQFLAVATDDAVMSDLTSAEMSFATGLQSSANNLKGPWKSDYANINRINLFLEKGLDVRYIEDSTLNVGIKELLKGEAHFLRAWYHWDLLRNYAGIVDGEVLGVPIVTKVLDVDSAMVMDRNTLAEVVGQIVADCDTAEKYLPIQFTGTDKIIGAQHYGAPTQYACMALKAKVLLLQVSPAFNLSNDINLWRNAAIQAVTTLYSIEGALNTEPLPDRNFFEPENYDVIWRSAYSNNASRENNNFPPSLYGRGYTNPSQNLVDAFFMSNGYPITDSRSGYSEANPYMGRGQRFGNAILYNQSIFKNTNIETFQGGKDSREKYLTGTRTGYYLRKHMAENVDLYPVTKNSQSNFRILLSLTDLYLNYAEAMNEFGGPDNMSLGYSPKMALTKIRKRAGFTLDPYLDEVASSGKDAFRELLKQERRVELCFEGERYFDLRRWGDPVNDIDVLGMKITTAETPGIYNMEKVVVETRKYKSSYGPIPFDQLLIMVNLKQNDDWK
jgi:starch-binding outer membrane protein, SusD/RagB family